MASAKIDLGSRLEPIPNPLMVKFSKFTPHFFLGSIAVMPIKFGVWGDKSYEYWLYLPNLIIIAQLVYYGSTWLNFLIFIYTKWPLKNLDHSIWGILGPGKPIITISFKFNTF